MRIHSVTKALLLAGGLAVAGTTVPTLGATGPTIEPAAASFTAADIAEAVDATLATGTARFDASVRVTGESIIDEIVVVEMDGQLDFGPERRARATMRLQTYPGPMTIIVDGRDAYLGGPGFEGLLPSDMWLHVDADDAPPAFQELAQSLRAQSDNAVLLYWLLGADDPIVPVGREPVGDSESIRLTMPVDLDLALSRTPPAWRDAFTENLAGLREAGSDVHELDAWIGVDGTVRRIDAPIEVPMRRSTVTMELSIEFSDLGEPLELGIPDPWTTIEAGDLFDVPGEPDASADAVPTTRPTSPPTPGPTPPSGARVIELEADAALRFLRDGEQVRDIPVVPGETVVFRIANTAGFEQNFYVGSDEALAEPYATTDVGISSWDDGVRELVWTVPDDIGGLRFGCTVPGHFAFMQGDLVEGRRLPDGAVEPLRDGRTAPTARPGSGDHVIVPWARFAITVPGHWESLVDPEPPSGSPSVAGLSVYGDGGGCFVTVERSEPHLLGPDIAGMEGQPFAVDELVLAGQPATRTDYVGGYPDDMALDTSLYDVTSPDGWHYLMYCSAEAGYAPADRWLSIAETLEFLPAE
jgi:hypothetical protein